MMIYLKLFWEFFKIGLFTFGGGYAMIPLVKETVINNEWLTIDEFYSFLAISESTPGSLAVNMATLVGEIKGGICGAICATLGVVLPSFVIIILIITIIQNFLKNKYVIRFIEGIKPVIIGLIVASGFLLIYKCIFTSYEKIIINYNSILIFSILLVIMLIYKKIFKKSINTIIFIIIAAFLGIICSFL